MLWARQPPWAKQQWAFRQTGCVHFQAPGFPIKCCHWMVCGEECRKEFTLMKACNACLLHSTHPLTTTGLWEKKRQVCYHEEQTWFLSAISRHRESLLLPRVPLPGNVQKQLFLEILLDSLVYTSAILTAWQNYSVLCLEHSRSLKSPSSFAILWFFEQFNQSSEKCIVVDWPHMKDTQL